MLRRRKKNTRMCARIRQNTATPAYYNKKFTIPHPPTTTAIRIQTNNALQEKFKCEWEGWSKGESEKNYARISAHTPTQLPLSYSINILRGKVARMLYLPKNQFRYTTADENENHPAQGRSKIKQNENENCNDNEKGTHTWTHSTDALAKGNTKCIPINKDSNR